jgi:uncharacterized heparinase superfamily protein
LSFLRKLQLYFYTLRYLKLEQVWSRVTYRMLRPKPNLRPAPRLRSSSGTWVKPALKRASMVLPTRFRFLNIEHDISESADWNSTQISKLWLYNLHYFDDLNADGAPGRSDLHQELIIRWMTENPPGKFIGWEPYPLSLRIVNWIKWALAGNFLDDDMCRSLAVQARFLIKRLERHLLGNHLFANAKALVFAGCFFEGEEADAWLRCGIDILRHEIQEQILVDGGHFERSTMYHSLALEDMLDLVNVTQYFSPQLPSPLERAIADWPLQVRSLHAWLLAMSHPDGEIGLFNDAAFDIAPSVSELDAYTRRILMDATTPLRLPVTHLKESGYIRLVNSPAVALLDVAPIGPDYLPGHAHADTLTFEFSLGEQRVLVNSGTSCYGIGAERMRQRGTAAHNTVTVNGQDSSEVWSSFRVARRAYPFGLHIEHSSEALVTEVQCAHNGYKRLTGKPIHHRTWRMDRQELTVIDRVEGSHKNAEARFHFHPIVVVQIGLDLMEGTAKLPDGNVISWRIDCGQARLEPSTWHPRFGQVVPNVCLVIKLLNGKSVLKFSWSNF